MKRETLRAATSIATVRPRQLVGCRIDKDVWEWCKARKIKIACLVNLLLRQAMEASEEEEEEP